MANDINSDNIKEKISQITSDILSKMGLSGDIQVSQGNADGKQLSLLSITAPSDSGFLIGKNGNNLEALEHIIRAVLNKVENFPKVNFILDINDYRKIKTKHLTEIAKSVADRVSSTAKAEALDPMTSYERRMVHMELASYNNIATESVGEEPKRRIVIKPL